MALQRFHWQVPADCEGLRLDHVLHERAQSLFGRELSRSKIRQLIMAGAVSLNSKPVRIASKPLIKGARIEIRVDFSRLDQNLASRDAPQITSQPLEDRLEILFEDADLIAVNKPAGIPTQPTLDRSRDSLVDAVRRYLSKSAETAPYIGMHHRLDRDTSGVIVFAKSKAANPGLAKAFSERQAQKTYQALCQWSGRGKAPALESQWTTQNFLAKVTRQGKSAKMGSVRSGGDPAITHFKIIRQVEGRALIEAAPKTGRMHQIRVHLAEAQWPILGDPLYAPPEIAKAAKRTLLHAAQLSLPHPISGKELTLAAPFPLDFLNSVKLI